MKTKIELDLKSIVIGVAATALVMFATGAGSPVTEGPQGNVGHYEVSVGADGRAAIVDTITGQAWVTQIPTGPGSTTTGTSTFMSVKNIRPSAE